MANIKVIEAKFERGVSEPIETHDVINFSPFNYDYSKLDKENLVLFIAGPMDVSGTKYRQSKYPLDFSNVFVGNFDCHGAANIVALPRAVKGHLNLSGNKLFKISNSTAWPIMTESIDVSHSNVTDLSVFMIDAGNTIYSILPLELEELVIDKKIKDNTSPEVLELFMEAYPNLTVTTKYIPLDRLDSNDKNILIRNGTEIVRHQQTAVVSEKKRIHQPIICRFQLKNPLYEMDIADIRNILNIDPDIIDLKLSKNELDKHIKNAITNTHTRTFKRIRPDSESEIITLCISRDDFDKEKIKINILSQIQTTKDKESQKLKDKFQASADHLLRQKNKNKQTTTIKTSKKHKHRTYSISKYIPQTIWKQIKTECGNDVMRQKQTLENIQRINLPSWNIKDGPIPFIDHDGEITQSQTTRKHGFRCIAQSLGNDSRKSAPRIVWSCSNDGLTFVATAFFSDHTKSRLPYKAAIQYAQEGRDTSNTLIEFETIQSKPNTYNIKDILQTEFSEPPSTELLVSLSNKNTK